jgi:hypothetical protein
MDENCSGVGDRSGNDLADNLEGWVLPGIPAIGDELIEVELHNDLRVGVS